MSEKKSCIFVELKDDRFVIIVLSNPTEESDMYDFFKNHEAKLRQIKTTKKTRMFIDLRELSFSLRLMTYLPNVVAHFLTMQSLSNEKLKACSVLVSNAHVANIIQPILDRNPGEVPTLINSDEKVCKQYLRNAK